jgi:ABC-type nitrate/sulfonate/bicarbonate transport system substrate-binding protein
MRSDLRVSVSRRALVAMTLAALVLACRAEAPTPPASVPPPSTAGGSAAGVTAPTPEAVIAPLRELKIGVVSTVFALLPLWAAQTEGYFAAERLAVEETYTSASTTAYAALVSGNLDLTVTSPGGVIQTRQKGTNLAIVGGFMNRSLDTLLGQRDVRSLEELSGKRLGVGGTTTGDSLLIRAMLAAKGMHERDDYTFIRVGGTPEKYTALQAGAADAVLLLDPFNYVALDHGFSNLGSAYTFVPEYQFMSVNVDGDWARQNEAALVGFQKALVRGIRWVYEPANTEAALKLATEKTGVERKYAEAALGEHVRTTAWPRDGLITEKGLEWVIHQSAAVGELEPPLPTVAELTDQSYTRKALEQLGR